MSPFLWLLIGLVLIFLEFFIPGMLMGILGIISIIASLVFFSMSASSLVYVVIYIGFVILLIIALFKFALWRIRSTRNDNSLYLQTDQEGFKADKYNAEAIGKEGKALMDLRPSGSIIIDGRMYQAMSQGEFIPKGTSIIVVRGEGPTLIVKTVTKDVM